MNRTRQNSRVVLVSVFVDRSLEDFHENSGQSFSFHWATVGTSLFRLMQRRLHVHREMAMTCESKCLTTCSRSISSKRGVVEALGVSEVSVLTGSPLSKVPVVLIVGKRRAQQTLAMLFIAVCEFKLGSEVGKIGREKDLKSIRVGERENAAAF